MSNKNLKDMNMAARVAPQMSEDG